MHRRRCVPAPLAAGLAVLSLTLGLRAQQIDEHAHQAPSTTVPLQPLAMQVRRLETALAYLGEPLQPADLVALNEAISLPDEAAAVARLQAVLDWHVLVSVQINPESRVRVEQGADQGQRAGRCARRRPSGVSRAAGRGPVVGAASFRLLLGTTVPRAANTAIALYASASARQS
jgi:hypothetical protein